MSFKKWNIDDEIDKTIIEQNENLDLIEQGFTDRYTKNEVNNIVEGIDVDLSNYYTKVEINNELEDYAKKVHTHKIDDITELREELRKAQVVAELDNLVVNGDFSDGASGWIGIPAGSLTSNGIKIQTTKLVQVYQNVLPTEDGETLYFYSDIEVYSGSFSQAYGGLSHPPLHTESGLVSNIYTTLNSNGNNVLLVRPDSDVLIKKTLTLNLTQTFGAGNEPSKEQMDELMKVVPNQWWDGELTLEQKEVVQWLLKLESEKADKQQEAWITPTLLNGFTGGIRYRINEFDNLEIIGSLTFPSNITGNNSASFRLPMSYVPNWFEPVTSYKDQRFKFSIPTDDTQVGSARAALSSYNGNFIITHGNNFDQWHINISIPIKA